MRRCFIIYLTTILEDFSGILEVQGGSGHEDHLKSNAQGGVNSLIQGMVELASTLRGKCFDLNRFPMDIIYMHYLFTFLLLMASSAFAQESAEYRVLTGSLHQKGRVFITVLPEPSVFKVQMAYKVKKKDLVPVPASVLRGQKIFDFPNQFRTEAGYHELEQKKQMEIPKAVLKFVKRGDLGDLKNAYFIEVHPTNKKSKIDIVYHPQLPSVGWNSIKITFISPFPILDGYELAAELRR